MGGTIADFCSVTSDEMHAGIFYSTRQLQGPSWHKESRELFSKQIKAHILG